MSKKALRLGDYLQHMRDAADRVQRYTADKSQDDFAADEQLQDAVVMIPTAVHYPIPLNRQPTVVDAEARLPQGDDAAAKVVSLPMHPHMTADQQARVVRAIQHTTR